MPFNALVMCKEQACLPILEAALEHLEITFQTCTSSSEAVEYMSKGHYSALVIDFDLSGALSVARMARLRPAQRRPVVFAMIGALTAISSTFQAGANFVLYKPLIFDQIVRSLRAGRGFMRPDRRHSKRQALETLVYLQFGVAAMPAVVTDLNETGLALQAPEPLPHLHNIPLRFVLPGTMQMIEGAGEMIWADDTGRAGILFSRLTPASRKQLKLWLNRRNRKSKTAVRPVRVVKTRAASASAH
jgi:ActR/RegA family two-component response regulator